MKQDLMGQPEVKKAFEEYNSQERKRLFRIICWVAIFAMPAGISLDMQVYPHQALHFFGLRLASSLIVLILLLLFYSPWGSRHDRLLFLILPMIPLSFITWMIFFTEGGASPYYAGLNVVLVAFCLLVPWTYQETLTVSLATLGIYLAASLAHGGVTFGGIFFNNLYFLTMTAMFAVLGTFFTNRLRVREFALRYELDQNKRILEETNQKLIDLDRMKSQFFANISHELRTPLTLLIAPLEELLRAPSLDQGTRETFRLMQANAMRLLKLINDLLDLAKLESGRMEVHREPLKVAEFIRGMALSVQAAARDKRVQLSSALKEDPGTLFADRDKLEKIVLNLLFNAVKFTPAGGRIDLTFKMEGEELVLQFKDTGMGISEKDLPHIFDRFWQADATAQRKYQGTGIGLSLVKELTEAQGGRVTVESQLGKGSVMQVWIPAQKPPLLGPGTAVSVEEEGPTEKTSEEWLTKLYRRAELFPAMTPLAETLRPDDFGSGKRPKVLVADDEPDMLRFLKTQLEKNYEVLEAVDGNQALEKARQYLPDLVLLDMMMPEKDGIEACREMKMRVSTQTIPVILLTARADDETKLSALNAGANDFLTKPFSTTELQVRVRNLIESHQLQRDLARKKSALESTLEQLKETEGQLVQNEKMASLGRLSAGIIHEINNPLNYAATALHLLKMKKDRLPEAEREKYIEIVSDIEEGVDRVQKIVSDLRSFSHPKLETTVDRVSLEEVVSTARRFIGHELKDKVAMDLEIPQGMEVLADKNKIVHVFVNLFQNAVDAMKDKDFTGEGPRLSVGCQREGDKVMISVRDNGMGIAPENLGKVFDPFFTTKDVGQGMGLGLSICHRVLKDQGGDISVKSEKGRFTEFTVELPAPN